MPNIYMKEQRQAFITSLMSKAFMLNLKHAPFGIKFACLSMPSRMP